MGLTPIQDSTSASHQATQLGDIRTGWGNLPRRRSSQIVVADRPTRATTAGRRSNLDERADADGAWEGGGTTALGCSAQLARSQLHVHSYSAPHLFDALDQLLKFLYYNYRDSNFNTRVRTRCGDFLTERRSSTTGRRHQNPAAVPGCNHDYRELNSKLHGHDGQAWLFHRRCSSSCCRSCLRQPGTPCRPAASLSEHRAGSERIRSRVSFCLSRRSPS